MTTAVSPDKALSEALIAAVRQTVASLEGDINTDSLRILDQVEAIAADIQELRTDLAALGAEEIKEVHLTTASGELDAVVNATEKATGDILDAVEVVETVALDLCADQQDKLMTAVASIYEACNFQDITGQRINKVVRAMKQVEGRVDKLLGVMNPDLRVAPAPVPERPQVVDGIERDTLMNGPQMPEDAMTQDQIDALLADF